jgi:hypothetical protein
MQKQVNGSEKGSSVIPHWLSATWQGALIVHINKKQLSPITSFSEGGDIKGL